MSNNVLTLLPGKVRQGLYVGYGLLVIGYGAVDAAYPANPDWLDVAGRVLVSLAVPFAALAAVNVVPTSAEQADEPALGTSLAEREAVDDGTDRGWGLDSGN